MRYGRRSFLKAVLAAGAVPYMRTFAASGQPRLRMGVLSDIHIAGKGGRWNPLGVFLRTLKWFDSMKVDGVVIAGDMAEFGMVEQLKHVGEAWDSVFPGSRAADGRSVEKVFVTGNHDHHFYKHKAMRKKYPDAKERYSLSIARDFDGAWRYCFHEPYLPFTVKSVKGYTFAALHYAEKGLPEEMAKLGPRLDPDLPFFYVQHTHLKDTCYGPWAGVHDDGVSTETLSQYPNCVAFSGHSHYSLVDERSVWQGAFTSVGTASLKYISPLRGYENGGDEPDRTKEMPMVGKYKGKQGMLMEVFDDRIVLDRRSFSTQNPVKLGPDWVIPLPYAAPGPFSFAIRRKKMQAPQFSKRAKVKLSVVDGVNRKGEKRRQVEVAFPPAVHSAGSVRAFDYEIEFVAFDGTSFVRRVLSPAFNLPPVNEPKLVKCVFGIDELKAEGKFLVYPRNSFGRKGNPIETKFYHEDRVPKIIGDSNCKFK